MFIASKIDITLLKTDTVIEDFDDKSIAVIIGF